jgi:lincosamide nucleotidyltransferase A/C/D/E
MDARTVQVALMHLGTAGIPVWVDGGWGVDALLGCQTREHDDLDLVVDQSQCDRLLTVMNGIGFHHDTDAAPGLPARLVLCQDSHSIDFHPVIFDNHGNGWQELGGRAWGLYPAGGLRGIGHIEQRTTPCITAELQVRHHLGYKPQDKDLHDVRALAGAFNVAIPPDW